MKASEARDVGSGGAGAETLEWGPNSEKGQLSFLTYRKKASFLDKHTELRPSKWSRKGCTLTLVTLLELIPQFTLPLELPLTKIDQPA